MEITSISPFTQDLTKIGKGANVTTADTFQSLFQDAINLVNETSAESTQAGLNLLTGDVEELHNVVIAAEKADIALNLTLQIRNKVVEAYNEVMRMQI